MKFQKIKVIAALLFILISSGLSVCIQECWARGVMGKQAEEYFRQAIQEQKSGNLDFAVTLYKKAIIINPDFKEAYNNLGTVYMQRGDLNAAEEYCRQAVAIDSRYQIALKNIALIYARRKDYDKFFEYWKMAHGLDLYAPFFIDE